MDKMIQGGRRLSLRFVSEPVYKQDPDCAGLRKKKKKNGLGI